MVVYSECQGELYAIHVNASRCARTELGPMNRIGALISEQRVLIRRLAAGADAKTSSADRLVAIGIELDHILLRQLALSDQGGLVVAPSPCLHALSWSHLPLLRDRAFSVANDVKRWRPADFASNAPRRVGIVLGPSLEHGISEADDVESLYEAAGIQRHRTTTVAGTVQIFDKVDLLHIVAHGDFRTDNPLFSSIHLDDGPMDVLDLEQTTSAPHLVVLSSCQGGETRLGGGGQLSGTTSSLLRLGVRSVIAPLTIVPDVQSHPFMIDLHSALLTGALADDALRVARSRANGRGDGANLALASTFHVFA